MLVDAFVNVSEKRKFTLFIHASGNWWPCCSSCPPRKVTASIYRLYPATCGLKCNDGLLLINPFAAADITLPVTTPPLALRFFTNEISFQSSSRSKGGRPRGKLSSDVTC